MTKFYKIPFAGSVLLFLTSIVISAKFIFTPIEDMFFYNIPISLSIIATLYALSLILFLMSIIYRKETPLSSVRKVIAFIICITFVVCSVFIVNAYTEYKSFQDSRDTSLLTGTYDVDDEKRIFLPYYDYFYNIGGNDAYYAFAVDKVNQCEYIVIDNRPYTLSPNSISYTAKRFSSANMFIKLKYKLENWSELMKYGYVLQSDFDKDMNDGEKVEIYSNGNGYMGIIDTAGYICTIQLSCINKNEISLDDFSNMATEQFELLVNAHNGIEWIEDKGRE